MNKVEIIKGINATIEGLETIKKALNDEVVVEPKSKTVAKEEPANNTIAETENEVVNTQFDVEQLNSMKYNEFKKFASSLGVKCTGTRDEIMERILALDVVVSEDGEEVEVEEPTVEPTVDEEQTEVAPTKSDKTAGSKKLGKKKVEEPSRDEFDEQAEEIAKNTDVEDILEALSEVGLEANKKTAVSVLAKALREGLIELEEDEDDEVETVVEDVEDTEEDVIDETTYSPQFDPKGYNNPENMTEERAEAVLAKMDEILTAYSEGNLTDEDIASFVEENATEEEIDLLGEEYTEEDVLKLYMELVKRTIDNEGEEHGQGEPYEVADKDLCCGRELKYSKKTKKYICEFCGTEYEAE